MHYYESAHGMTLHSALTYTVAFSIYIFFSCKHGMFEIQMVHILDLKSFFDWISGQT